jgi:hypothetical protein
MYGSAYDDTDDDTDYTQEPALEAEPAARAEDGETKTKKKNLPQSDTPGVCWHSRMGKWAGYGYDRLKGKMIRTTCFVDEADCKTAHAALRAEERARFEAEVAKRMAANPALAGLPRAPAKAADATPRTVYWHVAMKTNYVPYRAIVVGKGGANHRYVPACQDCHRQAAANVPKGPRTHCLQHGGGILCAGHDGGDDDDDGSVSNREPALEAGAADDEKTKKIPQSDTPGVSWYSRMGKWKGAVYDRLKRKMIRTTYFVDEADCKTAHAALRAEERARFEAEVAKRMAADPKLTGLPRAPAKAADATPRTVYWHVYKDTKYVPYRAVVNGKANHHYRPACQDCHQMAFPNVPKGPATHCKQHGGGRRCKGHDKGECPLGFSVQLGKRDIYDGRCSRCFCHSFPNDPRAARARSSVHAREHATTDELKKHFPDYNWVFDKTFSHRTFLVGVNTRFRPDARVTQGDRVIIIEIDEQSHRGYLCSKEREREESFVKQNRNKTVVMIRFNPDSYIDYEGVRHPSCFTDPTKDTQVTHLHPKRKADWDTRIRELVNTIRNVLDPKFPLPPKQEDRPLLICELFYDDVMATPEDRRVARALAAHKAIGKRIAGVKRAAPPVWDDFDDSDSDDFE